MHTSTPTRILIVDDEPDGRQALERLLQRLGHKADSVSSGEEAIAQLSTRHDRFDLVFVDHFLYSGMDGFETLRRLKVDHPDIPVVLYTGAGDVDSGVEALRLGAYRYVFKPINPDEIDLIIQSARETEGLRREKEWLSNLLQISNAMLDARDLDRVLQTIAGAAQRVAGFGQVVVSLLENDDVHVHAMAGLTDEEAALLQGRVYGRERFFRPMQDQFQISQSFYVPTGEYNWYEEYGGFFIQRDLGPRQPGEWQSGDLLHVPIYSRDENTVGIISVDDPADHRPPSFETIRALELLAGQAAIAIENARLFAEERRRRQIADALTEVPKVINGTLKLEVVLDRILHELQRVLNYDSASVQLLNKAENGLKIIACHGFENNEKVRSIVFPLDPMRHPNVIAWKTKATMIVKDVQSEYPAFAEPGFEAGHVRGWLGVPLIHGVKAIGALSIDSRQPNAYHDEHAALAMTFANQAAIAIANARLFEEVDRRKEGLETLLHVGQQLAGKVTGDPRQVLDVIANGAAQVTHADCVVIYPYNNATKTYDVQNIASMGLKKPLSPRETPRRDSGLGTSIIQQGQLILPDVEHDERARQAKFMQRERIRACVGTALIAAEEAVGILYVNYRRLHDFNMDELQTINIFAHQAAIAIYNSRLYQRVFADFSRRARDLENMRDMEDAIIRIKSSLDLSVVLEMVLAKAIQFTGAPYGCLIITDEPQRRYQVRASHGQGEPHSIGWNDLTGSLHGYAIEHKRAYYLDNIQMGSWRNLSLPQFPNAHSVLLVPLLEGHEAIGCLTIASPISGAFAEDDKEALNNIAPDVVLAMQNARRYELAQQEIESLESLLRIGQMVTQSLDLGQVLGNVVRQAHDLLPSVDIITLYYRDEADGHIKLGGHDGVVHSELLKEEEGDASVVARVMKLVEPLIARDAANELILAGRFVRDESVASAFAAPLITASETVGAMFVSYRNQHDFPEREINLLNIFASYAANAIRHARQYEAITKHQKHLAAMRDASRAMVFSRDADDILRTIIGHARRVTHAWLCTYQRLEDNELIFVQADPPDKLPNLEIEPGRMPITRGITGRAAREGKPILIPNVLQDDDYIQPPGGRPHAELAIPLVDDEGCLGVLNLEHERANAFSDSEVELLTTLAHDAVIAIRHAQHYQELKDARDRIITAEAIAGMGLIGSEWAHHINQKTFSFDVYILALESLIFGLKSKAPAESSWLRSITDGFRSLIRSLREISGTGRWSPGKVEQPTILDDEIARLAQLWCEQYHPSIHLVLNLQCPGQQGYIENLWLKIALEKIVRNALRALGGQGTLTISSRQVADYLEVTVHDTGMGLPPYARADFLKRPIRRPLGTEATGSGRGVLIARFVMLSHGGNLTLDFSDEQHGTQIRMRIPVFGSPAAAQAASEYIGERTSA